MTDFVFWKPIVKVTGIVVGGLFFLFLLVGGVIFWTHNEVTNAIASSKQGQDQLETAREGLRTIKQMVGNANTWSTVIKEEYTQLSINQGVAVSPKALVQQQPNYTDNFLESKNSLNQIKSK